MYKNQSIDRQQNIEIEWKNPDLYSQIPEEIKADNTIIEPVTMEELLNAIKNAPNKKSPGPDGITYEILKMPPRETIQEYLEIINTFFELESIPSEWIEGEITLFEKTGDPYEPNNHRPITLLNTLLKIYTSIITSRLENIIIKYNLISNPQCGFMKFKSTTIRNGTLHLVIEDSITRKKPLYIVLVDIKKAFDTITPEMIEDSLKFHKINTKTIEFFLKLYKNSKIRINIQDSMSDYFHPERGVKQGDPISPALFILAIEPLIKVLQSINKGYKFTTYDSQGQETIIVVKME